MNCTAILPSCLHLVIYFHSNVNPLISQKISSRHLDLKLQKCYFEIPFFKKKPKTIGSMALCYLIPTLKAVTHCI